MLSQIEAFVNWVRRRNSQARTWRDYGYDLKQFAALVGDCPPRSVSIQDIDRFVSSQLARGFKSTTINRRLAAILALYAYLADEDDGLFCPVLPHRHYLYVPQALPRPVQEDGLEKFFAAIHDDRDRAMFILMLRCGLRISEVAAMRLSDLYLDEDHPRLVVRGKGSRERTAYLSPQAERALRNYLDGRLSSTSDHVFLSYLRKGMSTTAIHKRLMRYREQAAVYLTCHRLRHSFANDLLNADMPITSIQKLMGHRWIESTQTYVRANDRQVQADYYAASGKLAGWA